MLVPVLSSTRVPYILGYYDHYRIIPFSYLMILDSPSDLNFLVRAFILSPLHMFYFSGVNNTFKT